MRHRPLVRSILALLAVLVVGTLGYMYIEGWRPLDALWMVLITLTTIGFGEIHPLSDSGRVFTIGLIVGGVSIGTYALTQLTSAVVEGSLLDEVRRRRRRREMEKLNDHFIVVGFGRLGRAVAHELRDGGVPFCIIERDPLLVKAIEDENLAPVIVGDGSHDDVLRAAGITRARGLAVALGSDAETVFVTLSARQLNPTLNIVSRVDRSEDGIKARRAGATSVVSPHGIGGWRIAHGLMRPHATHFVDLATLAAHDQIRLDELQILPDSPVDGLSLNDLRVRERFNVAVVAIRRPDGSISVVPDAHLKLVRGDVVIVLGSPEGVRAFGEALAPRKAARG